MLEFEKEKLRNTARLHDQERQQGCSEEEASYNIERKSVGIRNENNVTIRYGKPRKRKERQEREQERVS